MLATVLKTLWLAAFAAALTGCAGTLPRPGEDSLPQRSALLGGERLFGERVSPDERPDADLRGLDEAMRVFVGRAIGSTTDSEGRLQRLLWEMRSNGLLALDYRSTRTATARETFHERTGNCLAFTNLFVALAREAGLRVSYQAVDIPPVWSSDGELAILSLHVNVRVHRAGTQRGGALDRVVDFNAPTFTGNYPQRPVADHVIDALFYNNLAVDALQAGDDRGAFVYFVKALTSDPRSAATWANLGVLYQRHGAQAHAEAAFLQALNADSMHKVAMSNLARLYDRRGDHALAASYRERVRRHQLMNPYYHAFMAEQALAEGDIDTALEAIDRAIRLRDQEHQFHFLRARALQSVGDSEAARVSLLRAHDHAGFATVRDQYRRKLDELN
jgi:tetratricopeptide (TPR) repeat protein